ncbi:MAG: hypothetical protein ACOYXR_09045 [Nitrospirota bacterium]
MAYHPLRSGVLAHIVAVLALSSAAQAVDVPPVPTGPRVYRVSVFDKPATDRLRKQVAEGLFVFADRVVRFAEITDPALRSDFLSRYRDVYFATEIDPTGCFTLTHLGSEHGSVGVLAPYGLVGWQTEASGAVTGRLYQSPDSTYDLTLTERGDRFDGVGKGTLGFRGGAMLTEYFSGVRLPDATLGECFQEAAAILHESKTPAP